MRNMGSRLGAKLATSCKQGQSCQKRSIPRTSWAKSDTICRQGKCRQDSSISCKLGAKLALSSRQNSTVTRAAGWGHSGTCQQTWQVRIDEPESSANYCFASRGCALPQGSLLIMGAADNEDRHIHRHAALLLGRQACERAYSTTLPSRHHAVN